MGLFSSKTIVSVASSVYNLAGEEKDRPIFIENLVIRNILSGTKRSLGDTIPNGYLHGPGITFRRFFKWAERNYDLIGMPTGQMYSGDVINTDTVSQEIPAAANEKVWVQEASLSDANFEMWAEQWMLRNYPDLFDQEWEADFDSATKEVTITLPDESVHTFTATNFNKNAKYIFAYYLKSISETEEPVEEGSLVPLAPGDSLPDTTGYSLISDDTVLRDVDLVTTTTTVDTFSDGRPDESSHTTTTSTVQAERRERVWHKEEFAGNDPDMDAKITIRDILNVFEDQEVLEEVETSTTDEEIEPGVTRTRTIIETTEVLGADNSYREDTQKIVNIKWSPLDLFIYKIGSGNAELDNIVTENDNVGQFFPMIPFRLKNDFLSEKTEWEDHYDLAVKAFKKATDGGKYSEIEDELAENDDVDDMDYIYAVYAVPLNVIDNSARKYLWEFFSRMRLSQVGGPNAAAQYQADLDAYNTAYEAWQEWLDAPNITQYMEPEPEVPPKPTMPENEIVIKNTGGDGSLDINFDFRIKWNYILEGSGTGLGKGTAHPGDYWLEYVGEIEEENNVYTGSPFIRAINNYRGIIRIYHQIDDNNYDYMEIVGLVHNNYIYDGKSVKITAKEALEDGEESGFLIPLHYATFYATKLFHSTQMATACTFLVINSYEKTKQKWWQKGIFKVIFVVVIAVVSVAFTGGAGIGLLGSHLAVGGALGMSGMTAAIVGSIVNSLAALVLSTLITKLTSNMGVLGAVLGAVISIAVTGAMQNWVSGGGFNFDFSQLLKAENIMKLLDSAGQGYAAYVRSSIEDMQQELQQYQEEANNELRRVREQYFEQFGYGGGQIDPMMFVGDNSPVIAESRDTFLSRTLMTGSDVAAMSHDMLSDYVELTLTLPNAFT